MAIDLKNQTPKNTLPASGVIFGADDPNSTSPSTYAKSALVDPNVVKSISGGTTGLTPAAPANGDVVISGTLAVANGGTGVTTKTGTGDVVLSTNPTLVSPVLGTPASGDLTNCTNLPLTTGVTGILDEIKGGTGQSSYTIGDLLYASSTTALSKLPDAATGNALISGGVGAPPSWGKVGLTTHVNGTLPIANGGTGVTTLPALQATVLPSQGGNSGKFLKTDGSTASWDVSRGDIEYYSTISNLSAATPVSGKFVEVGGYYTVGDGGKGEFVGVTQKTTFTGTITGTGTYRTLTVTSPNQPLYFGMSLTWAGSVGTITIVGFDSNVQGGAGTYRVLTPVGLVNPSSVSMTGTFVDNKGTIVIPTGGDGSTAWVRVYSGPINVLWFGAYNNNTNATITTASIQTAIDTAIATQNAVFFPPGVYAVNSTINLPDDVTNPNKSFGLIADVFPSYATNGPNCPVTILSSAAELFKTKTAPGPSLRVVFVTIRNIYFKSTVVNTTLYIGAQIPTATCFSRMLFGASVIQNCGFYNWGVVILGAIAGRTFIRDNHCAAVQFLKKDATYPAVCTDSLINGNYINGLGGIAAVAGMQQVANIDISGSNSMIVSENYIDFSFIAVQVGGTGTAVNFQTVVNNVFDICYTAIRHVFGYPQILISGNEFLRISKSYANSNLSSQSIGMINSTLFGPTAIDLTTANWRCVDGFDQRFANVTITNNMYGDANIFIQLAPSQNWNIKEADNIGSYVPTLTSPPEILQSPADAVSFAGRSVQLPTLGAPNTIDNTGMSIASWRGQLNTELRAIQAVYPGLEYYIGSPALKVYVNADYGLSDQDGGFLFGKTNLLPTGTTNFNNTYQFTVSGATDVSIGSVYSSGGNNYTVLSFNLSAGSGTIIASGPVAPAASGTLTLVSGSGPSSISFSVSSTTTAWVFNTGCSNSGGVFTASAGAGWSYIPITLAAGTYMVCLNVTSIGPTTNNYVGPGASLAISPSSYAVSTSCSLVTAAGNTMNRTGRAFYLIKPSGTTARLGIFIPSGTDCTIDYINIIKIG